MQQENNSRLGYTHSDIAVPTHDISHLTPLAQQVCRLMSHDPFITQRKIADHLKVNSDRLLVIAAEIRADVDAQNYILYQGDGTKYWTNTIRPLLANGTLHAAIDREYMYPNRVGLYTGMSCMFYCNFCGRNPMARYEKDYEKIGFEVFKQIIDQDPKTDPYWEDRFRISGGLEPLTNRYLGDIITYGAERGYKMQLYTNGFMMTDRYITDHPGMLDLHAVRFSLYGVDKESAFRVTRHEQSFENIVENIINYINNASTTKVGVNWIVLPGQANDLQKLINVVDYINSKAVRPVDFVTLREDFSQNVRIVSEEEREHLIKIFKQIKDFKEHKWPTTHWDFGYALEPLTHGKSTGALTMINWNEMVPESFPQVAVAVDVKGDVYVYHESGFLDRPGADRYIIGNIRDSSVQEQTQDFILNKRSIRPMPPDVGYLDAFDHVVSRLIRQARDDAEFGIAWNQGPLTCR